MAYASASFGPSAYYASSSASSWNASRPSTITRSATAAAGTPNSNLFAKDVHLRSSLKPDEQPPVRPKSSPPTVHRPLPGFQRIDDPEAMIMGGGGTQEELRAQSVPIPHAGDDCKAEFLPTSPTIGGAPSPSTDTAQPAAVTLSIHPKPPPPSLTDLITLAKHHHLTPHAWPLLLPNIPLPLALQATSTIRALHPRFRLTYSLLPTSTWTIHSHPAHYHEVAPRMLRNLDMALQPHLRATLGAALYSAIDWQAGSGDTKLADANKVVQGTRQPDASVGMEGRALPTIVWETGFQQPYSQLQIAARSYLVAGTLEGVLVGGGQRVELVVLVVYCGQRPGPATPPVSAPSSSPSLGTGLNITPLTHDSDEYTTTSQPAHPRTLKPCTVRVEFWRLQPPPFPPGVAGRTRSHNHSLGMKYVPMKCQEAVVWPRERVTAGETLTVYARDVVGSERIERGGGLEGAKWEVGLEGFTRGVELAHSRMV